MGRQREKEGHVVVDMVAGAGGVTSERRQESKGWRLKKEGQLIMEKIKEEEEENGNEKGRKVNMRMRGRRKR